mmetsp:Transcript_102425/g.196581  ORF Transcript_102425/g.196581 Transcript_102425/m.196581 type:complete len:224 (-) Transcript_102425:1906-2577(-)
MLRLRISMEPSRLLNGTAWDSCPVESGLPSMILAALPIGLHTSVTHPPQTRALPAGSAESLASMPPSCGASFLLRLRSNMELSKSFKGTALRSSPTGCGPSTTMTESAALGCLSRGFATATLSQGLHASIANPVSSLPFNLLTSPNFLVASLKGLPACSACGFTKDKSCPWTISESKPSSPDSVRKLIFIFRLDFVESSMKGGLTSFADCPICFEQSPRSPET